MPVVHLLLWSVIQLENLGGAGVLHVIFGKFRLPGSVAFRMTLQKRLCALQLWYLQPANFAALTEQPPTNNEAFLEVNEKCWW